MLNLMLILTLISYLGLGTEAKGEYQQFVDSTCPIESDIYQNGPIYLRGDVVSPQNFFSNTLTSQGHVKIRVKLYEPSFSYGVTVKIYRSGALYESVYLDATDTGHTFYYDDYLIDYNVEVSWDLFVGGLGEVEGYYCRPYVNIDADFDWD